MLCCDGVFDGVMGGKGCGKVNRAVAGRSKFFSIPSQKYIFTQNSIL